MTGGERSRHCAYLLQHYVNNHQQLKTLDGYEGEERQCERNHKYYNCAFALDLEGCVALVSRAIFNRES